MTERVQYVVSVGCEDASHSPRTIGEYMRFIDPDEGDTGWFSYAGGRRTGRGMVNVVEMRYSLQDKRPGHERSDRLRCHDCGLDLQLRRDRIHAFLDRFTATLSPDESEFPGENYTAVVTLRALATTVG